jgi:hypothetical protein
LAILQNSEPRRDLGGEVRAHLLDLDPMRLLHRQLLRKQIGDGAAGLRFDELHTLLGIADFVAHDIGNRQLDAVRHRLKDVTR